MLGSIVQISYPRIEGSAYRSEGGEYRSSSYFVDTLGRSWKTTKRKRPLVVDIGEGSTGTRFLACLLRMEGLATSHVGSAVGGGAMCTARLRETRLQASTGCTGPFERLDGVLGIPVSDVLVPLLMSHGRKRGIIPFISLRNPWMWLQSRKSRSVAEDGTVGTHS